MRKSKAEKALDQAISDQWAKHGSGIQINIMDIPKIFSRTRDDVASGMSVEDSIKNAVERHRLN